MISAAGSILYVLGSLLIVGVAWDSWRGPWDVDDPDRWAVHLYLALPLGAALTVIFVLDLLGQVGLPPLAAARWLGTSSALVMFLSCLAFIFRPRCLEPSWLRELRRDLEAQERAEIEAEEAAGSAAEEAAGSAAKEAAGSAAKEAAGSAAEVEVPLPTLRDAGTVAPEFIPRFDPAAREVRRQERLRQTRSTVEAELRAPEFGRQRRAPRRRRQDERHQRRGHGEPPARR
jgi:hypothetical protein